MIFRHISAIKMPVKTYIETKKSGKRKLPLLTHTLLRMAPGNYRGYKEIKHNLVVAQYALKSLQMKHLTAVDEPYSACALSPSPSMLPSPMLPSSQTSQDGEKNIFILLKIRQSWHLGRWQNDRKCQSISLNSLKQQGVKTPEGGTTQQLYKLKTDMLHNQNPGGAHLTTQP